MPSDHWARHGDATGRLGRRMVRTAISEREATMLPTCASPSIVTMEMVTDAVADGRDGAEAIGAATERAME